MTGNERIYEKLRKKRYNKDQQRKLTQRSIKSFFTVNIKIHSRKECSFNKENRAN